jgi:hypothetical protein
MPVCIEIETFSISQNQLARSTGVCAYVERVLIVVINHPLPETKSNLLQVELAFQLLRTVLADLDEIGKE